MTNIRNFCILAHIDHGKSTLADRFLEITRTIPKEKLREQYLDMMDLERERGITIKMQPVRMLYQDPRDNESGKYVLNLIDTPGHVDFTYEVSRALAAVEGAILLVDASKGVQAQTLANFELAKKQNLRIIPVVNKIDLPNARIEETIKELASLLAINPEKIINISAKNGINIEKVLQTVSEEVPPPEENTQSPFRALIFDSKYDSFRGVIAYVRVVEGKIFSGEKILLLAAKAESEIKEIGYFVPELSPQKCLAAGDIGYIATGIKEAGRIRVGDTITIPTGKVANLKPQPLPGYKEPKPMVFASFFPEDSDQYEQLKSALAQLKLQDPSFIFESESLEALGRGFRCGFLGTLHLEIISERLRREFRIPLVISSPSVSYKIITTQENEQWIYSASDWPENAHIKDMQEPCVRLEILSPPSFLGRIMELLEEFQGLYKETKYLGDKIIIVCELPLREMIRDFYGRLKGSTQGYASMNYEMIGWQRSDLVKLEVLIAGKKEEAFSRIIPKHKALQEGRLLVRRLKELLPAQQFAVALQACMGGKIIARETIAARRKDVTAPLYGGDFTRKRKLLEKQKRGKKELKQKGTIIIPQKVFIEMVKPRS